MIGERHKALRKERKMSQEKLAPLLGIQKTAISMYETNKNDPSDKIKVEIAMIFNVSLDYLLGVIDERIPYYRESQFIRLFDDITDEESRALSEYISFLIYRRGR